MSVLPEPPAIQPIPSDRLNVDQPGYIHLEPRLVPATDSQQLIIGTALRLLAVWAVRAAGPAEQATTST